ncbi:MAG: Hpt domain-containing protein [Acidobacteriia bacterium]|nr:Hpt domain-containing protein [Terriglobia bacterium]
MDEIVKDFLTESREKLEELDQELARLESDSSTNESLANMVRSVHTIKGASGFLGFPHIERVTRAGECLLTRLRDGQLSRTAEVSGRVAALAGAVRQMLGEIESTGHDGENDYPDLLAELNRLASAASAGAR